MQVPSCLHRSSDVISALNDGSRNMADLVHIIKEIALHREPTSMNVTLSEVRVRVYTCMERIRESESDT